MYKIKKKMYICKFHSYTPALNTRVPFIVSSSMAALSPGNPALAGTYLHSYRVHGHNQRGALQLKIIVYTFGVQFLKRRNKNRSFLELR